MLVQFMPFQIALIPKHFMLKTFRIVAVLEGISYLLLLFIAVPFKYIGGNDILVRSLGMPHGILFISYTIMAFMLKAEMNWKGKSFLTILVASILPFGTFYVDKKFLSRRELG